MKILDTGWRNYSELVIPADATDDQRKECRRAFYAGACALLNGLHGEVTEDIDDETSVAVINSLSQEFEDFTDGLKQGTN